jgi:hypothetical protein
VTEQPPPPQQGHEALPASEAPNAGSEGAPAAPPLVQADYIAGAGDGTNPQSSDRPEVAVGAAFAGGLVLALILRRLGR